MAALVRLERKRCLHYRTGPITACGVHIQLHPEQPETVGKSRKVCRVCEEYVRDLKRWEGKE